MICHYLWITQLRSRDASWRRGWIRRAWPESGLTVGVGSLGEQRLVSAVCSDQGGMSLEQVKAEYMRRDARTS